MNVTRLSTPMPMQQNPGIQRQQTVAPQPQTPKTTGPSAEMKKYIASSGSRTEKAAGLTSAKMLSDISEKATKLGAPAIKQNSQSASGWLKNSCLGRFFSRVFGGGKTESQKEAISEPRTTILEEVNGGIEHFGEAMVTGSKALKINPDAETLKGLDDTKGAVNGQTALGQEEGDTIASGSDKGTAGIGIGTTFIAFVKAGFDTKDAVGDLVEARDLRKEATGLENKAISLMQTGSNLATIADKPEANTHLFKDDAAIDAFVGTLDASSFDVPKIKDALKAISGCFDQSGTQTSPLPDSARQTLYAAKAEIMAPAMDLMSQAKGIRNVARGHQREGMLGLATGVGTMLEKSASFSANVATVTAQVGKDVVSAQATAVAGVAASVVGVIQTLSDCHDAFKASAAKDLAAAFRNPTEKSMGKLADKLQAQADKLQSQANALKTGPKANPEKAALLEAQAKNIGAKAKDLKEISQDPAKLAAVKEARQNNTKLDAMIKQVEKRQGVGFKILTALKSALATAGAIALTVAVFAGAAAVAATPVGWVLGGVAAVAAVGLGVYKLAKVCSRVKEANAIQAQYDGIKTKLDNLDKNEIPDAKAAVVDNTKLREDAKKALDKADPGDANYGDLKQAFGDADAGLKKATDALAKLESDQVELKGLKQDCSVLLCRKSPEFSMNKLLTHLKLPAGDPKNDKKRADAESMVALGLGMDPNQLRTVSDEKAKKMLGKVLKYA